MEASLYSYTGDWQSTSSTDTIFYDNGDGSDRLHVYNDSNPEPFLCNSTQTSTASFTYSIKPSPINFKVWVALEESLPDEVNLYLLFSNGGVYGSIGAPEWLNDRKLVNTYLNHQLDPTKTLRLVNCFGQAAIIETVLGLGLSYKRLHWEVLAPFGYIDEDLTGWGSTNSPFFEGDTRNARFKNVAGPMRTPFRPHVFVTISPTEEAYVQSESLVVDACAGPVAGDLTYTQYVAGKALHDGIGLLERDRTPPKKPWNGVETTTGTQQGWTLSNKLESLHPGDPIPVSKALSDLSTAFASDSLVSDNFNAETVIHAILDPILANTGPGLVLKPQSSVDTTLNDSTTIPGASTTRLSVAGNVVGPFTDPTFISFQISEFSGGLDDALSGLQQRFNAFTLPTAWVKDKKINIKGASTTSDKGIHDTRAMVFGTFHLDLFLYKNLVVQIAGNSNATSDALLDWTKAMWAELIKY